MFSFLLLFCFVLDKIQFDFTILKIELLKKKKMETEILGDNNSLHSEDTIDLQNGKLKSGSFEIKRNEEKIKETIIPPIPLRENRNHNLNERDSLDNTSIIPPIPSRGKRNSSIPKENSISNNQSTPPIPSRDDRKNLPKDEQLIKMIPPLPSRDNRNHPSPTQKEDSNDSSQSTPPIPSRENRNLPSPPQKEDSIPPLPSRENKNNHSPLFKEDSNDSIRFAPPIPSREKRIIVSIEQAESNYSINLSPILSKKNFSLPSIPSRENRNYQASLDIDDETNEDIIFTPPIPSRSNRKNYLSIKDEEIDFENESSPLPPFLIERSKYIIDVDSTEEKEDFTNEPETIEENRNSTDNRTLLTSSPNTEIIEVDPPIAVSESSENYTPLFTKDKIVPIKKESNSKSIMGSAEMKTPEYNRMEIQEIGEKEKDVYKKNIFEIKNNESELQDYYLNENEFENYNYHPVLDYSRNIFEENSFYSLFEEEKMNSEENSNVSIELSNDLTNTLKITCKECISLNKSFCINKKLFVNYQKNTNIYSQMSDVYCLSAEEIEIKDIWKNIFNKEKNNKIQISGNIF